MENVLIMLLVYSKLGLQGVAKPVILHTLDGKRLEIGPLGHKKATATWRFFHSQEVNFPLG